MMSKSRLWSMVAVALVALTIAVGCAKPPNDTQITADVQGKINADSGLSGKQLVVQSAQGAVTLSGSVDNDAQRDAAARYASSVNGVKQVVNNLQITAPAPVQAEQQTQPTPPAATTQSKPRPRERNRDADRKKEAERNRDADNRASEMAQNQQPAPVVVQPPAPVAPPPPPPPVKVTIPAGTTLAVRLESNLDSEVNQLGQTFQATLNSALTADGNVAIPAGSEVQGHIVDLKSAGKFAGQSVMVLQLDSIASGSNSYNISTDQYKRQGSSRGKNTAEKVGAGAGIGALIGALAGGGKGAAIGAAAGGDSGAACKPWARVSRSNCPQKRFLTLRCKIRSP